MPNMLLEGLARAKLGAHEFRVLHAVARKTLGWHKAQDKISASQLEQLTGIDRRNAWNARNRLIAKGFLIEKGGMVGINPNSPYWNIEAWSVYADTQAVSDEVSSGVFPGTQARVPADTGRVPTHMANVYSETPSGVCPGTPQKKVGKDSKERTANRKGKETSSGGKSPRRPNGKEPPPTAATWEAYNAAYIERYGVEPVRNATVNSKLAQLVKRLGEDLAPLVAAYYVTLNTRYYVQKGHTVGPLLADAEKLATECRTNTRITETSARRADQSTERLSVFQRLLQKEIESNEQ